MRFQTSPCFRICKRSPSTARISVAESKSSSPSRLLASRYCDPTCLLDAVWVALCVDEQPVSPREASAVPSTEYFKNVGNVGCHKIAVGLYIKESKQLVYKFIFQICHCSEACRRLKPIIYRDFTLNVTRN